MRTKTGKRQSVKATHSVQPIFNLVLGWALLVPTLFFVARGTFSFDRVQSNNLLEYDAGTIMETGAWSIYYRGEQMLMYLVVCLLIWPVLPSIFKEIARPRNYWLILLPIWGGLSMIWSQDPMKTLLNIIPMFLLTCFGTYLTVRLSPERQVEFFLFAGVVTLAANYLLVIFYPSAGIAQFDGKGAWQGLFVHKNQCGILMTYMLIPAFCVPPSTLLKRLGLVVYVIADLFIIVMTQSRTGWLTASCCLVFLTMAKLSWKFAWKEKVLIAVCVLAIVSLISLLCFAYMSELAILLGKDATLTGRTNIWATLWPVLGKRPYVGYGYSAFWLGMRGESATLNLAFTNLANAENAVMQMWLELGGVGVVIMCAGILISCKHVWWSALHRPSNYTLWCSANVFLTVLALVDGDKIMFPNTIEWALYVASFISLSTNARNPKSQKVAARFGLDEVRPTYQLG